MTPEALMEFQLSQARLRATIATLSVVCGVMMPFFGYLGLRYVNNMDEASSAIGRLTMEMAVLNTQMTNLRDDIQDLQGTVSILQDRARKALYTKEGIDAETHLPTASRVGAEGGVRQAWGSGDRMYGFSNPPFGRFVAWQSEG